MDRGPIVITARIIQGRGEVRMGQKESARRGNAMELNEVLLIIFTAVVALATIAYTYYTGRLVSETRSLREAQTAPRLSVSVDYDRGDLDGLVELVIKNHGAGPAQNITLGFEGDPDHFEEPIDQVDVIANGFRYLEPYGSWRIPLGWFHNKERFERATKNPWVFNVRYEDSLGKDKADIFTIDFRQFEGLWTTTSPIAKIARGVESMGKDMKRVANGTASLRMITQTKEELVKEHEQRIQEGKERR